MCFTTAYGQAAIYRLMDVYNLRSIQNFLALACFRDTSGKWVHGDGLRMLNPRRHWRLVKKRWITFFTDITRALFTSPFSRGIVAPHIRQWRHLPMMDRSKWIRDVPPTRHDGSGLRAHFFPVLQQGLCSPTRPQIKPDEIRASARPSARSVRSNDFATIKCRRWSVINDEIEYRSS